MVIQNFGLEIEHHDGDKAKKSLFNWNQAAKKTAEIIDRGDYITAEDVSSRIKYAEYILKNVKEENSHSREYAEKVLKKYNIPIPEGSKKLYDVFIYDGESKTNEPVRFEADNKREARKIGITYISQWNLLDDEIMDIREVQSEREKIDNTIDSDLINIIDKTSVYEKEETDLDKSPENSQITDGLANDIIDYHIDTDNIEIGGEKAKFRANIAAIETLKIIEAQHRNATHEEQEIMPKYTGWGNLQNAFDSRKSEWSNEYSELRELLTDEEYNSAKASVLDAFYTPPFIIESIYNALNNMGFKNGNILEPS